MKLFLLGIFLLSYFALAAELHLEPIICNIRIYFFWSTATWYVKLMKLPSLVNSSVESCVNNVFFKLYINFPTSVNNSWLNYIHKNIGTNFNS